ncbi:unnamed protein product [Rodentolepis nana]|uniref:Ovule protein n=1 Tax=Rodentolepis nana TaxID=102285 RepID=A0A0R3TZP4_RODNA|nr:unnamed protein product [Rodentolepis nana]
MGHQTSQKPKEVSEADIPKTDLQKDSIKQDQTFTISSMPYCPPSPTMDHVEAVFEYPVVTSTQDCPKPDTSWQRHLYFQPLSPNEAACVSTSNEVNDDDDSAEVLIFEGVERLEHNL